MIEGIRQIGSGLVRGVGRSEDVFVEELVEKEKPGWEKEKTRRRKEKPTQEQDAHLVILKITTDPVSLHLDFKEVNEDRLKESLWVGNAGSNDDQDRVTTDHLEYLISQTIPNLLKEDRLPQGDLRRLLQEAYDKVYLDLGKKEEVLNGAQGDQNYSRYRYLWDLQKLGVAGEPSKEDLRDKARRAGKAKTVVLELEKFLKNWICKKLGLKPTDIALYTLEVDGHLLAAHPEYKHYIFQRVVGELFKNAPPGVCHLCGGKRSVTANTKFFRLLKFYNTDKIGFASGLDEGKGFYRNYALCQDCYMSLLAGDNFVRKNLQSNLAYNVVYLIPSFHLDIGFSPEDLERWAKYLHSYLGKLTSLEGWRKFQQQLENFRDQEEHKASFLINFLFVQRSRAEVRIQKLVQDVPPFRLDLLVEKRNEIKERGDRLFEESDSWDLSLRRIFWLFPVRKHQQMVLNTDVLNFYEALFTGRAVKHGLLMANFLEMSRMHYYKNYRPYVHKPQEGGDTALVRFLLQSALLISYLKALKMLKEDNKGGEMMDEFLTELPEDIKNYIEQMDYGGSQAGLFLLGYLIGRIGTEQHKASPGSTKKPILNKINFMAMSLSRIQRLSNDIFEKLDQYRILPYNERIFAAMKGLLDKNRSSWGLSHQENVYYILSGYAYATWGAIREGLERKKSTKEGGDYNEQSNAKFGDLVPL